MFSRSSPAQELSKRHFVFCCVFKQLGLRRKARVDTELVDICLPPSGYRADAVHLSKDGAFPSSGIF